MSYDLERRVAELEHRVAHLYQRLSVENPPVRSGLSPQVMELLAAGNKIGAIKQHRAETGLGLAEAKEAIEGQG